MTFLIAFAVPIGIPRHPALLAAAPVTVLLICITIAWCEVYDVRTGGGAARGSDSDGSLSLSISRGLEHVQFTAPHDEAIAYRANKIVRRSVDKQCITYQEYRTWRQKNPTVFNAITDREKQLIGFFDVFPLVEEAGRALIGGTCAERELSIDAILPFEQTSTAKYVYIASIVVNPKQQAFSGIVAKELLLLKFAEFITSAFPPTSDRILFAYAHTRSGELLLRNAGFRNTALSADTKQRDPLYQLTPAEYRELVESLRSPLIIRDPPNRPRRRRQRLQLKTSGLEIVGARQ